MLRSAAGSFLVYLVIRPDRDNYNVHNAIMFFYGVDNTDSYATEFYFEKSGQIRPIFISQWFSISALINGNRILADFLDSFKNLGMDGMIQFFISFSASGTKLI